jgi:hypothetical protein
MTVDGTVPTLAELVCAMDTAGLELMHAEAEADAATDAFVGASRRCNDARAAYMAAVEQYHLHRTQAGLGAEQI